MTDQTLTDADLLAWAVIGEYRQRERRDGLTILLLPFPPCLTCGEQVYDAETSTVERGIDRISTINMAPCGHAYTVTDDEIERVHRHAADLVRRMEAADNSRDPNVWAWTTADVIREAQAAFAPAVPVGGNAPINAEQSPRTIVNNPPTSGDTASDQLRQRIVDSLADYPVACWTPVNLAGRVMGVVGGELDQWEKTGREQSARADVAERQLRAVDFTASHWHQAAIDRGDIPGAHAIACIRAALKGETRPEQLGIDDHLHDAFRAALDPQEQP